MKSGLSFFPSDSDSDNNNSDFDINCFLTPEFQVPRKTAKKQTNSNSAKSLPSQISQEPAAPAIVLEITKPIETIKEEIVVELPKPNPAPELTTQKRKKTDLSTSRLSCLHQLIAASTSFRDTLDRLHISRERLTHILGNANTDWASLHKLSIEEAEQQFGESYHQFIVESRKNAKLISKSELLMAYQSSLTVSTAAKKLGITRYSMVSQLKLFGILKKGTSSEEESTIQSSSTTPEGQYPLQRS